ncbi:hypothetical protein DER46DRAFT_597710 [Fusarium sp. MPI-SDFR-AT-0072]|nr:hypothetical protein DER46DRAFT_597710 [Fusarium sp. MPI-SDFR-AT-0072]
MLLLFLLHLSPFPSQHSSIFYFTIFWLEPNELCCANQCICQSQFLSPHETIETIQKLQSRKHQMYSQHATRSTFHYSPAHLNAECWAQQNPRGSPVQSKALLRWI